MEALGVRKESGTKNAFLSKVPCQMLINARLNTQVPERLTGVLTNSCGLAIASARDCDLPVFLIESPHSASTKLSYVRQPRSGGAGYGDPPVDDFTAHDDSLFHAFTFFFFFLLRGAASAPSTPALQGLAGRRGGGAIIAGRASSRSAVGAELLPQPKHSSRRLFFAQKTQQRRSSSDLPAHSALLFFFFLQLTTLGHAHFRRH